MIPHMNSTTTASVEFLLSYNTNAATVARFPNYGIENALVGSPLRKEINTDHS